MSAITAPVVDISLRKNQAYSKYARGEISLREVMTRVSELVPPHQEVTGTQRILATLVIVIVAMLTPPWARRD